MREVLKLKPQTYYLFLVIISLILTLSYKNDSVKQNVLKISNLREEAYF